jgi:uncharacterized CHY-type Zn-finger protein
MIEGDGFICGGCGEEIDPPTYFSGECPYCNENDED